MPSPKNVNSSQPFVNALNAPFANGVLTFDLSQSANITGSGGLLAPRRVSITLNASGVCPLTPIWFNDQLTPSGTTYLMQLFDSGGNFAGNFGAVTLSGGSPLDLSTVVPISTSGGTISFPGPVLLNPSGPQTITGFGLTLTSSAPLTVNGLSTLATVNTSVLNNIIVAGSTATPTLASAFTACAAFPAGCNIFVPANLTFTSPITYDTHITGDVPIILDCLSPGDINQNLGGTTITYTPSGTGTTALTFNNTTRVIIKGCNFTQGNTQANTNGILYSGVQGGSMQFSQVHDFTNNQFTLSDSATSSGEYNTFVASHFIGGVVPFIIQNVNGASKSCSQNTFFNCVFKFGSANSIQMTNINGGGISENGFFGCDVSGNSAILVALGDGTHTCRDNVFLATTIESAPASISTATQSGTTVTLTFTATFPSFAVGQSVLVAGVGVGGYNGTFTLTAATPTSVQYTTGAGLGNSSGGTVVPNSQIGWDNNAAQMTSIHTEGGMSTAGTPKTVNNRNNGTYDLKQGSSNGPGGIKWEYVYPAMQGDKDGNMALGAGVNVLAGTPPSLNVTAGWAICSGGCGFQIGGQGAIIIANHGLDYAEGTAPAGSAGNARVYGDSTAHRLKMINNNGTATTVAGFSDYTLTLKKGSGAGTYTSASTTYVVVDSTNLCFTVTIPTGFKLLAQAQGSVGTNTAIVAASVALTDNASCSTANAGLLQETSVDAGAAGAATGFSLGYIINGDGASHNIALQFKTANAADSVSLLNSSSTLLPTMTFALMPSN